MVFHYAFCQFASLQYVLGLHVFTHLYILFLMASGSYGLLCNPFLTLLYALTKFGWVLLIFSWISLYIHFAARLYIGVFTGHFLILAPVLSVLNCALLGWCLLKYRVIANEMEGFIYSRRQQRIAGFLNQPAAAA